MYRLRIIWILAIAGCAPSLFGQSLVANGGFEDENTCTELKAKCAPEAWFIFSREQRYINKPNYAFEGSYFISMIILNRMQKGKRTFIESKLLCPLKVGNKYRVSMMVRAEPVEKNFLYVHFRKNDMFLVRQWTELVTDPSQLISYSKVEPTTKKGWNKVEFGYTANGSEQWLVIGHLTDDENVGQNKGFDGYGNLLYYIDNVSVLPEDPDEKICSDYEVARKAIYDVNERHSLFDERMQRMKDSIYNPPRMAKPARAIKTDTLLLSDILFDINKSTLNPKFTFELDQMAAKIKSSNFSHLTIVGHTDSVGTESYNQQLSESRATTIFEYLVQQKGFDPLKMEHRGEGERRPVASNAGELGRQRNRRVEVILFRQD